MNLVRVTTTNADGTSNSPTNEENGEKMEIDNDRTKTTIDIGILDLIKNADLESAFEIMDWAGYVIS